MVRSIGGFVLGWLVMGVVAIACFLAGPLALGIERVFEPGTYDATGLWIALAMAIGLVAGLAGGWVAARVGRGRGPALALAVLILVSSALGEILRGPAPAQPEPRPEGQVGIEALLEARGKAREPLVTRVTNPLVGLLGVGLGAWLALRGRQRRDD